MSDAAGFLRRSDALYLALAARARRDRQDGLVQRAVRGAQNAARLACFAHTGRFADGRLENLLLEIGREHVQAGPATPSGPRDPETDGTTRVLHVATRVLATGGHTRMLVNWIRQDRARRHSLVIVDQPETAVPSFVGDAVEAAGGTVTVLTRPRGEPLDAAVTLRRLAERSADAVLLHIHQFDAVPLLAFASPGGPPVALVNHSDHTFWLGSSIADVVVPFRPFGERLGARRFVARQSLVPIPLAIRPPGISREEARRQLGLGVDDVALLTIGARYKYEPTESHDFFARAEQVLATCPKGRLYVVGITADELPASAAGLRVSARAHFVGVVPDPALYQAAADVYLEGFPIGSLTALLESVAMGAAPVLMHDPVPQLDISEDAGLRDLVTSPSGAAGYERRIAELVGDARLRTSLAASASRAVVDAHMGERWIAHVDALHSLLDATKHEPAALPESDAELTQADTDRAAWDAHLFSTVPLGVLAAREPEGIGELWRCLAQSVRVGDTRISAAHLHAWAGAIKRHALGAPVE